MMLAVVAVGDLCTEAVEAAEAVAEAVVVGDGLEYSDSVEMFAGPRSLCG